MGHYGDQSCSGFNPMPGPALTCPTASAVSPRERRSWQPRAHVHWPGTSRIGAPSQSHRAGRDVQSCRAERSLVGEEGGGPASCRGIGEHSDKLKEVCRWQPPFWIPDLPTSALPRLPAPVLREGRGHLVHLAVFGALPSLYAKTRRPELEFSCCHVSSLSFLRHSPSSLFPPLLCFPSDSALSPKEWR